jgi:hypothetical protein
MEAAPVKFGTGASDEEGVLLLANAVISRGDPSSGVAMN